VGKKVLDILLKQRSQKNVYRALIAPVSEESVTFLRGFFENLIELGFDKKLCNYLKSFILLLATASAYKKNGREEGGVVFEDIVTGVYCTLYLLTSGNVEEILREKAFQFGLPKFRTILDLGEISFVTFSKPAKARMIFLEEQLSDFLKGCKFSKEDMENIVRRVVRSMGILAITLAKNMSRNIVEESDVLTGREIIHFLLFKLTPLELRCLYGLYTLSKEEALKILIGNEPCLIPLISGEKIFGQDEKAVRLSFPYFKAFGTSLNLLISALEMILKMEKLSDDCGINGKDESVKKALEKLMFLLDRSEKEVTDFLRDPVNDLKPEIEAAKTVKSFKKRFEEFLLIKSGRENYLLKYANIATHFSSFLTLIAFAKAKKDPKQKKVKKEHVLLAFITLTEYIDSKINQSSP